MCLIDVIRQLKTREIWLHHRGWFPIRWVAWTPQATVQSFVRGCCSLMIAQWLAQFMQTNTINVHLIISVVNIYLTELKSAQLFHDRQIVRPLFIDSRGPACLTVKVTDDHGSLNYILALQPTNPQHISRQTILKHSEEGGTICKCDNQS